MLHWTERAVDDLLGIGDRIPPDNPSAALVVESSGSARRPA